MTPIARSRDGRRILFDDGDGFGRILDAEGVLYPATRLDAIFKFGGWFDLDDFQPAVDPDEALARLRSATDFDPGRVAEDDPVIRTDVTKRHGPAGATETGDTV